MSSLEKIKKEIKTIVEKEMSLESFYESVSKIEELIKKSGKDISYKD